MELVNMEVEVIEGLVSASAQVVVELQDLQLALVGGGIGDAIRG
jgi:hypothetical protein